MTWRMLVFAIGAALLAQGSVAAQVPADLQEAIRAREEAFDKKDAAAWDRLTTADFTVVNQDGRISTKAERLADLKGEKPSEPRTKPQQEHFTRYGDTVIRRALMAGGFWVRCG
jgi:hypothetical protein